MKPTTAKRVPKIYCPRRGNQGEAYEYGVSTESNIHRIA